MTAKEKAKELVDKFRIGDRNMKSKAKQCALICIDEILQTIPKEVMSYKPFMMNTDYWQEVKEEINKL
jgi:hypothetical protein